MHSVCRGWLGVGAMAVVVVVNVLCAGKGGGGYIEAGLEPHEHATVHLKHTTAVTHRFGSAFGCFPPVLHWMRVTSCLLCRRPHTLAKAWGLWWAA
jgi:hypothetical protein